MKQLRCCVIIPTYNNAGTLEKVVREVQEYTDEIIVVNDGSTDGTAEILEQLAVGSWQLAENDRAPRHQGTTAPVTSHESRITLITLPTNQGKGIALRRGFASAIQQGYTHAITIDSDGQHFPEDIPGFIEKVEEEPDAIVIGARNMKQKDVPGTSSFGHKFSIFWFRVETGLKIPDVQSGFRLYPLERISSIRNFYSSKYEFEVEVLVRLAWRGVSILPVPVKIWYGSEEERVSHFRKGVDFTRTSLLNTILVAAALLWVRPFHFARGLRKMSFREIVREYFIDSEDSNAKLAWSLALGIFIGVSPFWGYQMVVAVALAHFFKLNKFVSLVASNISIPPMIPVILFCSYTIGGLIIGTETAHLKYSSGIDFQWIKQNLIQYIVGSFVFGALLSPLTGFTTYLLLALLRKRVRAKEIEHHQ
ncbi:MAG: DUF2062 domain-containing protein [Bacteroidetes bacterium]|nr:MAG: DUF2062 domain-containing protein [Bacteroidota bacterium]